MCVCVCVCVRAREIMNKYGIVLTKNLRNHIPEGQKRNGEEQGLWLIVRRYTKNYSISFHNFVTHFLLNSFSCALLNQDIYTG